MKKIGIHTVLNLDLYSQALERGIKFNDAFEKGVRLCLNEEDKKSDSKLEVQQSKYNEAIRAIKEGLEENNGGLTDNTLTRATFWEEVLLKKYSLFKTKYQLIDDARKLIK